jgi:hypothetical protein
MRDGEFLGEAKPKPSSDVQVADSPRRILAVSATRFSGGLRSGIDDAKSVIGS